MHSTSFTIKDVTKRPESHSKVKQISTPPYPGYTSGHSTFSAAAAAILTAEIGSQVPFTDSSKIFTGFSPRSFSNFNEAAQEAAIAILWWNTFQV